MENAELVNMALVAANVAKVEGFSATQKAFENIIRNSVNLNQPNLLENSLTCSNLSSQRTRGSYR